MNPKTLRVRASGTALVQNFEHLDQGRNSFIGRTYKETEPGHWAFVPTEEAVEVPFRTEYLRALQTGCLEAADAATAKVAGLDAPKASLPPPAPSKPAKASESKSADQKENV